MKKSLKLIILIAVIVFIAVSVNSCSFIFPRIEGLVVDSDNGSPLNHVKISILHSNIHAYTNKDGMFIIHLYSIKKPKYVDLSVFKVGYEIKILRVYLDKNGVGKIEVNLRKSVTL